MIDAPAPRSGALAFAYGILCYAVFFAVFLYGIGFIGGFFTPTMLDGAPRRPLSEALLIDLGLLTLFAVQHSVMARPAFKRWWTRFVPEAVERSTYVLMSSLALAVMYVFWEPIGGVIWTTSGVAREIVIAIYLLGWALLLYTTFLIDHFDLFGLRQVFLPLIGRPYTRVPFRTPLPYRYVRHPLYLGFLLAFWMTPTMTLAHLVFAIATTAYIVLAIQFEEKDLVAEYGAAYERYRRGVPMLLPIGRGVRTSTSQHARSSARL